MLLQGPRYEWHPIYRRKTITVSEREITTEFIHIHTHTYIHTYIHTDVYIISYIQAPAPAPAPAPDPAPAPLPAAGAVAATSSASSAESEVWMASDPQTEDKDSHQEKQKEIS
jgi:hypothetical protein